jgi:photosystem II stability/assembly factor-like uncharacterized protein
MANLAIACLVMDPTNPNVIYAGTGEGFQNGDAVRGAGIFKTSDGGTNWAQLSSTTSSSFHYVNRLAICPTNSLVILAATPAGIFRSADGGTSWTNGNNSEVLDIQFHPTDGSQCVAGGRNGNAFYSLDGGFTWNAATGLPAVTTPSYGGRVELAYAPSASYMVYASVDNNSGEIYISYDGGQSYSLASIGYNYMGAQGWYDNCLWVDPTNPFNLVVGGVDLWLSADGGSTFTKISDWRFAPSSAHADHHVIVSQAGFNGVNNTTVFFGDDGGVYSATNIYTVSTVDGWTALNNNLGITQFYGAAGNPTSGTIVGGAQDNGTLRYTTGGGAQGWTAMFGGDGGFCASDPADTNYFYGEYVYLQIHRSTDGGASSSYIFSGIGDAGGVADPDAGGPNPPDSTANFIAPFILDPNNSTTMLAGGLSLWRSGDVKDPTPIWTAIKPSTGELISTIAVAPGNSDILWVGHNDGSVYFTTNGTAGSPTWNQANLGVPNLPARYCTRLAIDPHNANWVYATFGGFSSGNVWRTTNSGATWTDLSGSLPSAPVNSLVIKPSDSSSLYVGTEVGIFASSDGGASWSPSNDGPANVAVDELFWMGNTLVAATHGRGCFSIAIPSDGLLIVPGSGFTAGGPAGGPFNTSAQSFTLTNIGTTSLNWSLINTSVWLQTSLNSGTLTPGGPAAGVTVSLNSTASNLVAGIYTTSIVFSNLNSHLTQSRQFSLVIGQSLVQNGGFERGDFSFWTLNGSGGNYNFVDNGTGGSGITPHSGTYAAAIGQVGLPLATVSQNLPTFPGQLYWVSFWLDSPDGATPNEFSATWGGITIFDQVDMPAIGWTNLQFLVTATSANTVLQFGGRDDATWLGLDDVSAVPVTPPLFQSATRSNNVVNFVWRSIAGLVYQAQYNTNLTKTNWVNLGSPVTATGPTATNSDAIGSDPRRFYRLLMLP